MRDSTLVKYQDVVDDDDIGQLVAAMTERFGVPSKSLPIGYSPHRKQAIAHYAANMPGVDTVVLNCGRRSGKSEWATAEFTDRLQMDYEAKRRGVGRWEAYGPQEWEPGGSDPEPFLHYCVVAPIYKLLDPLKRKFQRMLGTAEQGGVIVKASKNGDWWATGGVRIDWRTGDNPQNLVADHYDGVVLDEFARLKADVWEDHLQPALADSAAWAIITSTPLSKASAFYRLWATGDPGAAQDILESTGDEIAVLPNVRCCYWTTMDNTANPHIRDWALRAKSRLPPAMWKRNFTASWVAFKGQIFIQLEQQRHQKVYSTHQIRRILVGKDFGWTNPGALSVWGEDHDGGVHELESVATRHLVIDSEQGWNNRRSRQSECWTAVAYKLLERWGRCCTWADGDWRQIPIHFPHDNPGAVAQFEARGFTCLPAYLDRLDGLEFFQRRIHAGPSRFSIASPVAWRSFESLVHPDGAIGRAAELWDKDKSDDHVFDASRYALSDLVREDITVNPSTGVTNWMLR